MAINPAEGTHLAEARSQSTQGRWAIIDEYMNGLADDRLELSFGSSETDTIDGFMTERQACEPAFCLLL